MLFLFLIKYKHKDYVEHIVAIFIHNYHFFKVYNVYLCVSAVR